MKEMFFLLLLLFLAIPLAEILVIVEVAQKTGILETIALLLIVSILGAWLVKSEGMGVIRKIPSKELLDGGLILIAGVLMLTPGFITDAFGLLLLFPLTRPIIRRLFFKRIVNQPFGSTGSNQDQSSTRFGDGSFFYTQSNDIEIVDLRREDDIPRDPPSLEN